jgi:hypothetical protein
MLTLDGTEGQVLTAYANATGGATFSLVLHPPRPPSGLAATLFKLRRTAHFARGCSVADRPGVPS